MDSHRLAGQRRSRQARRHRRPRRGAAQRSDRGAALDVTDPSRCPTVIRCGRSRTASSPRTSATRPEMAGPLLAERLRTNVRRCADDEPLIGLVDVELGY